MPGHFSVQMWANCILVFYPYWTGLRSFSQFFTSNCSGNLKRRNAGITTSFSQSKVLKKEDSITVSVSKGIRCFNCQEYGTHISKNCPKAKAERCMICGDIGHNRFACQNKSAGTSKGKAMKRNTYQDGQM
ncbi:hypothetical protein WA026_013993 [Henosepilachna vigintioctopunctata]|uniref:CCHC-type domain-containing protein n=1 Tax=Henosepilachna vigintioctopunctata TaxID=420089 RepID=A0AAW1U6Q6_9CUCU